MITQTTIDVLVRWYKAHKAAEDNSAKMLAAWGVEESRRVSDECVAKMSGLKKADADLNGLAGIPLLDLFNARDKDPGCARCWLSSRVVKEHPECDFKIREWFGYRDALMTYIHQVYILGK